LKLIEEGNASKKSGKDFWAGLIFVGFGPGFMMVSFNYPMGSTAQMGTGYFPTMPGGMLAILGGVLFLRVRFQIRESFQGFHFPAISAYHRAHGQWGDLLHP